MLLYFFWYNVAWCSLVFVFVFIVIFLSPELFPVFISFLLQSLGIFSFFKQPITFLLFFSLFCHFYHLCFRSDIILKRIDWCNQFLFTSQFWLIVNVHGFDKQRLSTYSTMPLCVKKTSTINLQLRINARPPLTSLLTSVVAGNYSMPEIQKDKALSTHW